MSNPPPVTINSIAALRCSWALASDMSATTIKSRRARRAATALAPPPCSAGAVVSGTQDQPGVRRYLGLSRDRPPFFFAGCPGYAGRDAAPETSRARVLLLEGDLPPSRVQAEEARHRVIPDALPSCRADNEELAHNLRLPGQAADQREARKSRATVDQVATSVGIFEEGGEPSGFVKPFAVRHGSPELGQVVPVQLPQPGSRMPLLSGGDQP